MALALDSVRIINDAHRMMVEELRRVRPQKSTNQGVMVCCPFHSDGTPSLSINLTPGKKPPGLWYCFGCGETGLWNKLARKMNLRTVDEKTAQQMTEFHGRKAVDTLLRTENLYDYAVREWDLDFVEPWWPTKKWRGFPGDFLQFIGALLAVDTKRKSEVVVLPVALDDTETVGYVKGLLKKTKGQLSYVNLKGDWSKTHGLFGYGIARKLLEAGATTLFVVEGPRDALRLLYYGVPAVAVLGANIWSSNKRDLLLALGATRIVIWFDNDTAGIGATNKRVRELRQWGTTSFVNANKLHALAVSDYGHESDKIDVGNTPVKLFYHTVERWAPRPVAGGWRSIGT